MKIQFLTDRIGFNIVDGENILETKIFSTEKKMYDYFSNLEYQSRKRLNFARRYELRYVGIVGNGNTKAPIWKLKEVLSDGCELWYTTIRIKQLYHKINFNSPTVDGRAVEQIETTVKDYIVYYWRSY